MLPKHKLTPDSVSDLTVLGIPHNTVHSLYSLTECRGTTYDGERRSDREKERKMESNDYHATNLSTVLLVDEERGEEDFGSDSEKERIGIDEILTIYTGEFGKWQKIHFVLTSLAWALEALHTMVMIFTDQEPFTSTPNICDVEPSFRNWSQGSGSSTVSEFGLVCGKKYQVGLVQSMFFAGCMIGTLLYKNISEILSIVFTLIPHPCLEYYNL